VAPAGPRFLTHGSRAPAARAPADARAAPADAA